MALADVITVEWAPADTPLDTAPTWVDITDNVRTIETQAGARVAQDLFGVGSAVLEVNNKQPSGAPWLDPNTWHKGRQIRIKSGTAVLFYGWIRSVSHQVDIAPSITRARIEAVDVVGLLSEASGDGSFETWWGTPPDADGTNGAEIDGQPGYVVDYAFKDVLDWLCDGATIPNALVAGDIAKFSRAAVFIPAAGQVASLSGIQPYLDAELGAFITRSDTTPYAVSAFGRYEPFSLAAAASSCTLTDTGAGFTWLRNTLKMASPDDTYVDRAVIGGKGFDPQSASDVPTGWPPSTLSRTSDSPLADRNWAAANAAMIVAVGSQTSTYPAELTMFVAGPADTTVSATHPALVARVPGANAFTVTYGGTNYKVRVIGISHQITRTEGWTVTFRFSSLDHYTSAYTTTSLFTLGTSALGGTHILAP